MDLDELVLVRHGETEWSRQARHTGRTDIGLTDLGRHQAESLAAMLGRRDDHDHVWSSPLRRARETMERAGFAEGARLDDDLVEWDYGDLEGTTTAEARRTVPDWSVWTHPVPAGESVAEVGARADRAIARATDVGGRIVLFAHGHLLRVLAARWLGLPPDAGRLFALGTASVSRLGHEREQRVITGWNERCHPRAPEPRA